MLRANTGVFGAIGGGIGALAFLLTARWSGLLWGLLVGMLTCGIVMLTLMYLNGRLQPILDADEKPQV